MGALGVAHTSGIVSPSYAVYRLDNALVEPRFIEAYLRQPHVVAEMESRSTGVWSSRLRLYPEDLLNMRIDLPSRDVQIAIAHHLDAANSRIDAAVAARQRQLELLIERRRAVLDALTVPAALGGSADAGRPWAVVQVKRGASFFTDGDWIESPYITDEGIRLIQTGNVGDGQFREQGFRYISDARSVSSAARRF
jgi:type I restriction enzyme S subunit